MIRVLKAVLIPFAAFVVILFIDKSMNPVPWWAWLIILVAGFFAGYYTRDLFDIIEQAVKARLKRR